jgi:hypothetical protein
VRHAVSFAEEQAASATGFIVAIFGSTHPIVWATETVGRNVEIRRPGGIAQVIMQVIIRMYAEIKSCVYMNRRKTLQCRVANVRQKTELNLEQ